MNYYSTYSYCILCWGSVISENHSLHILQKRALRLITNSRYISHTELLCKELRVLKVFDMFDVAIWKFYYKLMYNDSPEYFSTVKPTLPSVYTGAYAGFLRGGGPNFKISGILDIHAKRSGMSRAAKLRVFARGV